ncbi:MAG: hypothetical protein HY825_20445 [Acidobacteria bacterium]|nr:hypothetical protein [Acidobacteriota bacterium]
MREPLTRREARRLIHEILAAGTVGLSSHALDELRKDEATAVDAIIVLRAGTVRRVELRNGTWRYPVRTARMTVVVAFRSAVRLVVVTAWRNR